MSANARTQSPDRNPFRPCPAIRWATSAQLARGTSFCKGYGFATFADEAAAQRAIAAAAAGERLCSRRVGLHASRRPFRAVLSAAQVGGAQSPLQLSAEQGASINALLGALRAHPDRRAAVAAALQVGRGGWGCGAYGD